MKNATTSYLLKLQAKKKIKNGGGNKMVIPAE